jgi:hypothetical protein
MAESNKKPAHLSGELLARKGEAKPTVVSEAHAPQRAEPALPKGGRNTVALTVRLDEERYRRLVAYGARFVPRRSHQDILVAALDAYLDEVEEP